MAFRLPLTLFFCFIVFLSPKLRAQTERGGFLAGGNLGFNYTASNYTGQYSYSNRINTAQFLFTPTVGYFVVKNLTVGLDFSLTYTGEANKISYDVGGEYTTTTKILFVGAGPFVRYYIKIAPKWAPLAHVDFQYGYFRRTFDNHSPYGIETSESGGMQTKVGLGVAYFLTERIGLEALTGFQYARNFYPKPDPNQSSFDTLEQFRYFIGVGLQAFFK